MPYKSGATLESLACSRGGRKDDCEFLIKLHDVDQDGLLDFNEFVSTIMAK